MLQSTKCFMHISMLICSIGIPGITEERRNCPHDLLNLLLSVKLSKYLTLVKLKALDFVWKCWAIRRKHLQNSGLDEKDLHFHQSWRNWGSASNLWGKKVWGMSLKVIRDSHKGYSRDPFCWMGAVILFPPFSCFLS